MELTSFGEKLKNQANTILQTWEDFIHEIENDETQLRARFRFGIHESVALFALPVIFKQLSIKAPGIKLHLTHGLSRHLLEDTVSKRLDAALIVNPTPHPDLIIKELYKDHIKVFSLKSKVKDRLILNPSVFQSQELIHKLKDLPVERIETTSFEVAAHLALAGEGVVVLPERVAKALAGEKLKPINLLSIIDRHCLVYRPRLRETTAGQIFVQLIKEAW